MAIRVICVRAPRGIRGLLRKMARAGFRRPIGR